MDLQKTCFVVVCCFLVARADGGYRKFMTWPQEEEEDVPEPEVSVDTSLPWRPLKEIWELKSLQGKQPSFAGELERSDRVYEVMRLALRLLEYLMGQRGPRVDIKHFVNWDHTVEVSNVLYTCPESLTQLTTLLRASRRLGLRVRATGIAHSRSSLYTDEGHVLLDTRLLQRHDGPQIEYHRPTKGGVPRVTVMTGVIAEDFYSFLVDHKLTVLAAPIVPNETVGGMVAVSSHGSTWSAPGFGSNLLSVRLVDSSGTLRYFSDRTDKNVMRALRCHLGMFGIIYDMTFEVSTMKFAKVTNTFTTLGSVFYSPHTFKSLVRRKFLTEVTWYPGDSLTDSEAHLVTATGRMPKSWNAKRDVVWVRTIDLVSAQAGGRCLQGPLYLPTGGAISGGNVTGILRGRVSLGIARRLPPVSYHHLVDAFPIIRPGKRGGETSAAFIVNADKDFKRPLRALRFIIEDAERQIRATAKSPMNAILPRFVLNSDCFLCPANSNIRQTEDSGRSMVIDYLAPPTQEGFYSATEKFVDEFHQEKVRPHWAKRHEDIDGIFDVIRYSYGDTLNSFLSARRSARVDTSNMFTNDYLDCLFYRKCFNQNLKNSP